MRRLVLGIAVAVTSLMPVVGVADDQDIANFIKARLHAEQQQGNLQGFNVDMRVEEGTVWFQGHVSTAAQEMTILKTAQAAAHLGVLQVVDDIEIASAQTLRAPEADYASRTTTEAQQPAARQVAYQQPQRRIRAQRASFGSGGSTTRSLAPSIAAPPAPVSASLPPIVGNSPLPYTSSAPCQGPGCGYGGTIIGGDYSSPIVGGYDAGAPLASGFNGQPGLGGQAAGSESPSLPGYAWPSYAAHPNFGNVSYPQQYSPSAWPYIGPFYPYPQVPLGWRKVTLEWDDGFWMLDFHDK